jgi:large subunit ribosomal protein L14e
VIKRSGELKMNEYSIGQVVFSKSGRDKGRAFIVIKIENEYLYIVDGDLRKLNKPKKKKYKHVQKTNHIINFIKKKIEDGMELNDSEIRKVLEPYSPSSRNAINEEA